MMQDAQHTPAAEDSEHGVSKCAVAAETPAPKPPRPEAWWRMRCWIVPELHLVSPPGERKRLWRELQGEIAGLFAGCALGVPVLVWVAATFLRSFGGPMAVHPLIAGVLSLPVAYWLPFLIARGRLRGIVRDRLNELHADPHCMACGHRLIGTDRVRCSECGWVVPRPIE